MSLDGTVLTLSLLQGLVDASIEGERLTRNVQYSFLHLERGGDEHLGGIGILRGTEDERRHELVGQSLGLRDHRHRRVNTVKTVEERLTLHALILIFLEIFRHLLLQRGSSGRRDGTHNEEGLVGPAGDPRIL